MQRSNPWLQLAVDRSSPVAPANVAVEDVVAAPVTGPTTPQPFVEPPVRGLPIRSVSTTAALWWVGAHGGAGESTLASLDDRWQAAGHGCPVRGSGSNARPGVVGCAAGVAAVGSLCGWADGAVVGVSAGG